MISVPELPQENVSHDQAKPSILYLYDGSFNINNGVSNYIRTVGEYSMRRGCEVNYVVGRTEIEADNVTSITNRSLMIPANGNLNAIPLYTTKRQVEELMDRVNPDVVHVQMPFVSSMSGKVLKELNKNASLVGTFHVPVSSGWLRGAHWLNSKIIQDEIKQFDQIYSVSSAAQAGAETMYGIESDILPCPINIDRIRQNHQAEEREDEAMVITFLGRLVARKGIGTFIEAVSRLPESMKEGLEVRIIGDGSERKQAEQGLSSSGLSENVRFYGTVSEEDKYDLLAGSDVVACTSSGGESFGVVLLDAMAVGRPIVLASDIDGYSEVLGGAPASLVSKNDPAALARRIEAVYTYPNFYKDIFESQQELIQDFDISKKIGPTLLKAYGHPLAG